MKVSESCQYHEDLGNQEPREPVQKGEPQNLNDFSLRHLPIHSRISSNLRRLEGQNLELKGCQVQEALVPPRLSAGTTKELCPRRRVNQKQTNAHDFKMAFPYFKLPARSSLEEHSQSLKLSQVSIYIVYNSIKA